MRRLRDWISPVPHPLGGDGRWPSGHLWSGRQPATPRYDPRINARPHTGLDIAGIQGTPIISPDDGIVESWEYNPSGGWVIVIKHAVRVGRDHLTVWSRHAHCLPTQKAIPGHTVSQGDTIALLGSTGGSASPHDHTSITLTPQLPASFAGFLDPEPIYYPGDYEYMQQGHPYPNEVKKLQHRLNMLGYTPALTPDGDYGAKTAAAVKWFQERQGIEQTGAASELTLALMFMRPGKDV